MSNPPDQSPSILDQKIGQHQASTSQESPGSLTPLEEFAETGLELPINHLFTIDPLEVTVEDADLLIMHYRAKRLQFIKLEDKPKTVEKTRGPKLDAESSKSEIANVLGRMIGQKS